MVATNSGTVVGEVDMAPVPIVTVLNQIQHEQQYSNTNPLSRTH